MEGMKCFNLEKQDQGLITTSTKVMSLSARYFLKYSAGPQEASSCYVQGSLVRDAVVLLKRSTGDKEDMHYRILGVFSKYYNKWYLQAQGEPPFVWSKEKPPNVRLSLRLMTRKRIGTSNNVLYEPVECFEKYSASEIHRSIKACEIVSVLGLLETNN